MLPDYPDVKKKIDEWLNEFIAQHSNAAMGSFSEIRTKTQFEGHAMRITREDGAVEEMPFHHVTSEINIDLREVEGLSINDMLAKVVDTAHEMAQQKGQIIIEGVEEATTRLGNSFDAGGQPLSLDLLLQIMRPIEIDFDENGQPMMPRIVGVPGLEERARVLLAEAESSPEQKRDLDALIEEKRREWHDRESSRKLVG